MQSNRLSSADAGQQIMQSQTPDILPPVAPLPLSPRVTKSSFFTETPRKSTGTILLLGERIGRR